MTFPFRWRVIQPDWFDTPADKHDGANAWINYTHEHHSISVGKKRRTHRTFPMARPKCLMGDFTNFYGIYKAHQTNVRWTIKVFRLHCSISNNLQLNCLFSSLLENKSPKENIKAPCHGALCVHGFPSQRASNTERVSMSWRHHVCSFLSKNVSQISRHIYIQVEQFTFLMTYACTVSMISWVYKARSYSGILFWWIHQILLQVT